MKSEVLLVTNEGFVVPPELAQKTLATNTSAIGAALIHPEEGFVIDNDNNGATLKEWQSHQDDFKGQKVIYHFCESGTQEKVAEEDLQPFRTVVDGKEPQVVTFAIGSFEIENDGKFSDAFVLHEKYLRPKIEKMYSASGKNLDTLAKMLEDPQVDMEMKMLVSSNKNTIAMLLANGKDFLWTKADRKTIAPWGFTSDNYGVQEGTVAEAAPKRRFGANKGEAAPTVPEPEVKPSDTPGEVDPNKYRPMAPPGKVDQGPTAAELMNSGVASVIPMSWAIPNPDMGARKTKDWYKEYNHSIVPDNWSMRPPIQIPTEQAMKLSKTRTRLVEAPKDANKTFASALAPLKKDTEAHHIPTPPKPVVSSVESTKKFGEVLQAAKPVTDPKEWEKLENAYPNLHTELGVEETKVIFASIETREALIAVDAKKVARAWMHDSFKRMEAVQALQVKQQIIDELKKKLEAVAPAEPAKKRFGKAA